MKYTAIAHIFQIGVLFTCLAYFREYGYLHAVSFANPQVYIFFILPFSIIAFIFAVVYALFAKKNKLNIFERIAIILISIFLTILEALSTWFYILASTDLQTLIYILAFVLVFIESIWALMKIEKIKKFFLRLFNKSKQTKTTEQIHEC